MRKTGLAVALIALGGCNTIEGFGRDLAAGGEAITGAAVEAQAPARAQPVYRPAPAPVYPQPAPAYTPPPTVYTPAPQQREPELQYIY